MSERVRQTITAPHVPRCWAESKYGGEWVMEQAETLHRDRLHRRHKSTYNRFLTFRCNDASCPARMIALEYEIMKAAKIDGGRR